ncbi:hypothetical protein FKP32DRAFT_324453 [Trametes sanguinea]|nr:hypothetical protein FKP32DRAFT_324453 [Trametes sanguinea]
MVCGASAAATATLYFAITLFPSRSTRELPSSSPVAVVLLGGDGISGLADVCGEARAQSFAIWISRRPLIRPRTRKHAVDATYTPSMDACRASGLCRPGLGNVFGPLLCVSSVTLRME